ncbi:MAG: hypothetical protein PHC51_09875 [bacterium]|nr:hypothetical protein [bacterium]
MTTDVEFSATEVREILLKLFPHRKLVLSQFTFFASSGVGSPTGKTFRRGRRCYVLEDLLPIACVLSLKERGIALKVLGSFPSMIKEKAHSILYQGDKCWIAGFGGDVELCNSQTPSGQLVDRFLSSEVPQQLFWRFNVTSMAEELLQAAMTHEVVTDIAVAA